MCVRISTRCLHGRVNNRAGRGTLSRVSSDPGDGELSIWLSTSCRMNPVSPSDLTCSASRRRGKVTTRAEIRVELVSNTLHEKDPYLARDDLRERRVATRHLMFYKTTLDLRPVSSNICCYRCIDYVYFTSCKSLPDRRGVVGIYRQTLLIFHKSGKAQEALAHRNTTSRALQVLDTDPRFGDERR